MRILLRGIIRCHKKVFSYISDNQEIYGKILVDELIAEVNLMHRTVLYLFQFSKESKGVCCFYPNACSANDSL